MIHDFDQEPGGPGRLRRLFHVGNKGSFLRGRKPISSTKPGLAVHTPSSTDTTATVDIVAIHGFDGSYRNWIFQSIGSGMPKEANWLTGPQGIAKEIPNARIITFSYDVNVRSGYELVRRVLYGNSLRLLQNLSSLRKETESQGRPIVFIAHSLGGLILKGALVSCNEPAAARFNDIHESTLAAHFFGTPSSSSSPHDFHVALDNMFALMCNSGSRHGDLKKPRETLSKLDANWLETKLQPYKALMTTIGVFSYYEGLETLDIGMVVNRQPSFSSTRSRDSESSTGSYRTLLESNHVNLMRFDGPDHRTYTQFLQSLRNFKGKRERRRPTASGMKNSADAGPEVGARDERGNLAILSNIPVNQDLESFEPQEPLFRSLFCSRPSPSADFPLVILWGKAGAGKSTIARSLLRAARTQAPDAFMYRFHGETRDTIMAGYLTLFQSIHQHTGAPNSTKGGLGFTNLQDILNAESICDLDDVRKSSLLKFIWEWLLDPEKEEWWLVFDNVVDPDGIYDLVPLRGSGRIILTTRRADALHLGQKRYIPPIRHQPMPWPPSLDPWLEHGAAGPVLKIAALLSADPIPVELLLGNFEVPFTLTTLDHMDRLGLVQITFSGAATESFRLYDGARSGIRTWLADNNDTVKWALVACALCVRFYQGQTVPPYKRLPAQERQRTIAPHAQACYQSIRHVALEDLPTDVRWNLLGELCLTHGAYEEAIGYLKISLYQWERTFRKPLSEDCIQATLWLSTALRRIGGFAESVKQLKTLNFDKMIEQSTLWPLAIKTELAKADLNETEGDLESAEQILRRLLEFLDNIDMEDEPAKELRLGLSQALVTRHLARLLVKQNKMEPAHAFYQRTFIALENLLGPDDPSTIETGEELVDILQLQGQYDVALALLRRFLSTKETLLGARHPSTADRMVKIADLLSEVGDFGKAAGLYDDALAIMTSTLGRCHPRVLRTMRSKAASLAARGSYDKALEVVEDIIQRMNSLPLWYGDEDIAWAVAKQDEFTEQRSGKRFEELLEKSLVV